MALNFVPFAERVKLGFCSLVSRARLLYRLKPAQTYCLSVFHYLSRPFLGLFIPTYASISRFAALPKASVLEVALSGYIAQIADRVVSFVPINVVYMTDRESAMNIKPCKPVEAIESVINPRHKIPSVLQTSWHASGLGRPGVYAAREYASVLVVIKELAESFRCKIELAHAIVPVKRWCGKRPASVRALVGFAILAPVNAMAYTLMQEVQAGARPMPTTTQALIDALPPMVWPS